MRQINEDSFTNKMTQIYNSSAYLNVTIPDPDTSLSVQELRQVSNGMQFPPDIKTDDQLKIYDQRNIKISSFSHSESKSIGGNDLKLEKYSSDNFGESTGFAYNLPTFEKARGCYQCYFDATTWLNVTVGGETYKESTEPADNFVMVQPDAGYTYQKKKESTVYMIIGNNATHSDPIMKTATPLPGLDVIYGHPFPFYDYSENLLSDESTFVAKFDYIAIIQGQIDAIVIAFSVLSTLALILGIVAIVVYKMKDPKRHGQEEENLVDAAGQDLDD